MRKSTKLLKRFAALFLVVLLSYESFAAVVSDNDGAAFITKAEFDSMRNEFQTQINEYNTSIDNKIDSAISSYLSGVRVDRAPTNLFDVYVNTTGYKPVFYNSLPGIGSSAQTMGLFLSATRTQAYYVFGNLIYNLNHYMVGNRKGFQDDAVLSFGNPPWSSSYSTWTMVWYRRVFEKFDGSSGSIQTSGDLSAYGGFSSSTSRTSSKRSANSYSSKTQNGSGSGWIYQTIGGEPTLKYYDTELYPQMNISVIDHRYKNFASLTASYYISNNGKADNVNTTVTIDRKTTLGYWKVGTKPSTTQESNQTYSEYNIIKHEVRSADNWISRIIGNNTDMTIYALAEDAGVTAATAKTSFETNSIYFYDIYYKGNGGFLQENNLGKVKVEYYPVIFTMEQSKVHDYAIPDLTGVVGEAVRHGEGFPLAKVNEDNRNIKIDIKFTSTSGSINYKISKQKLLDGNFKNASDSIKSGTTTSGSTVTASVDTMKNGDIIYVNCYSATSGARVTIDSVTLSK